MVFPSADSKRPLYEKILAKRSRLKSVYVCIRFVDAPVSIKISVIESFTMLSTTAASEPSSKSAESRFFSSSMAVVFVATFWVLAFSSQNLTFLASKFALSLSFSLFFSNSAWIKPHLRKTVALPASISLKDRSVVGFGAQDNP